MLKVNKINVKIINKDEELGNSRLELKISGPNVRYQILNTLRRIIFECIPIYSFTDFKFDKNTSIFHNNYLKLRINNLPVWSIDNSVAFIEESNVKDTNMMETINEQDEQQNDDVEFDIDNKINSSTLKQMTMYINTSNKTKEIITITTDNAKFYYKEKEIDSPYKTPIPIVKLQPGQEIAFSAITTIGTENDDAMFSPVSICVYKQINDNEFDFIIESRGQISEKRILQVALINIERKLKKFIKLFDEHTINEQIDDKNIGKIIVNNEDHTLGNIITVGMQQHKMISFAGYNLDHPLGKKVNFHYKLKPKGKIKDVLKDVVEYNLELFSNIKKSIDAFD